MNPFRRKLHHIIFETSSKAAKRFDVWLLWTILAAVLIVMLESVPELGAKFKWEFYYIEWVFTIIFTIEFIVRIWISPKPFKYIFSFWGLIDFLSILPTYLDLFLSGYHYLLVVRIFRLLRIFRVLKLVRFSREARLLIQALKTSSYKVGIFFITVMAIVTFMGTIMYVVEGGKEGFTSIPQSIYWAIVTVTTVGYGDMVPHTVLGKFISSFAMIVGYTIIVVPTGIVTVEMARTSTLKLLCGNCNMANDRDAQYCKHCGTMMQ